MALIRVKCPACQTVLLVDEVNVGRQARCRKCQAMFAVERGPEPAAPTAPSPPVVQAVSPPPAAQPQQPRRAAPARVPAPVRQRKSVAAFPDASASGSGSETAPGSGSENVEPYPWETPPVIIAKVAAYDARSAGTSFMCKANEFINSLLKHDTFREDLYPGQMCIYPDIVGVRARPEEPGCLWKLAEKLPEPARSFLLRLAGAIAAAGCLTSIPAVLIGLVLSPFVFLYTLITWPIRAVLEYFEKKRLDYVAGRIREDPKSSYAIKKLFKYSDLIPRYWRPGEIVQIIRLDCRRRLRSHSLILFVQDDPFPQKAGIMGWGAFLLLGRILKARRRIYVCRMDTPADADIAAGAAGVVLGLRPVRAKFTFNHLALM